MYVGERNRGKEKEKKKMILSIIYNWNIFISAPQLRKICEQYLTAEVRAMCGILNWP